MTTDLEVPDADSAARRQDNATAVRFVHSSDAQIGMFRWFLDEDAQARFDAARLEALRRLGAIAVEQDCDFIVLAGDIFEYNSLSERTTGRALEILRSMTVPVYLLPGNHDPLVADSILRTVAAESGMEHVHLLADDVPVEVELSGGGIVEIVGAPLLSRHASFDVVARALDGLDPTDRLRIMVGHGKVESRGDDTGIDLIDLERVKAALSEGVIDYLALGDTHSTVCLDSRDRVYFSGAPETTDFHDKRPSSAGGESDSGNALVVDITTPLQEPKNSTVTIERVVTGQWVFEELHAELNSSAEVESFLNQLSGYVNKENTVIRYSFSGVLTLSAQQALEEGIESLRPVFAALFSHERYMDLVVEPGADELDDLAVGGYTKTALDELIGAGENDAVNLLFRLARKAAK